MTDKWTVHDFDKAPERSPRPRERRPSQLQRTRPERRSFNGALLVSVLLHGLLLSQLVGGEGLGRPGFVFPWQERRAVVPDIHMVLVPAPAAPVAPVEPSVAVEVQRASIRSAPAEVPTPKPPAPPTPRPQDRGVVEVPAPRPAAPAETTRNTVAEAVPVKAPPRADVPDRVPPAPPPPSPELAVIPAEPPEAPTSVVPAAPVAPTTAIAVDPGASSPDPVALARREAEMEAQRQEAARIEAVRLETERQDAARQATAKLEAQRQEAARQAAARADAARLDAERQETARQAAAQLEAQRQEAARKTAAQQESARVQAAQDAAAKREAVLRAIGRQLDEENARRDAASNAARPANTLPLSLSTARRGRLWGHTDPNAELVAYAQAWALKIQLNTLPDRVREVAKRPHTPPTVTVAMRSDGSVESMTFVVSSGVADIDEAIRRIVENQRPYPVFPPALAREFDVVEIRRTWYFDAAVRLH
jgi:hypothetical protein